MTRHLQCRTCNTWVLAFRLCDHHVWLRTFNQRILLRLWWFHRDVNFRPSDGDHFAIPEEVQMLVELHKLSKVTRVIHKGSLTEGSGLWLISAECSSCYSCLCIVYLTLSFIYERWIYAQAPCLCRISPRMDYTRCAIMIQSSTVL